jgi:rhodanese-related sulfurtransferase
MPDGAAAAAADDDDDDDDNLVFIIHRGQRSNEPCNGAYCQQEIE